MMRRWRYYLLRLRRLKGQPKSLALGGAIGVLIGMTPTVPFHTVEIFFLCLLVRGNALAGIIVSWIVCNPISFLPIYSLSAILGNSLTPWQIQYEKFELLLQNLQQSTSLLTQAEHFIQLGSLSLLGMITGSLFIAIPMSFLSYFIFLKFFNSFGR